jgi:nicotinamidase-related amidase
MLIFALFIMPLKPLHGFNMPDMHFLNIGSTRGCSALMFVEAQNRYRASYGEPMVEKMAIANSAFKSKGFPVFRRLWDAHCLFPDGGPGRWEGRRRQASYGCGDFSRLRKWENRLIDELRPDAGLEENRTWFAGSYSAFPNVPLHDRLKDLGVDTLVLMGGYTEMCIAGTALHAHALGFKVVVVRDGVGPAGLLQTTKDKVLSVLENFGVAEVIDTTQMVSYLPANSCQDVQFESSMVINRSATPFLYPYEGFLDDGEPLPEQFGFRGPTDGIFWKPAFSASEVTGPYVLVVFEDFIPLGGSYSSCASVKIPPHNLTLEADCTVITVSSNSMQSVLSLFLSDLSRTHPQSRTLVFVSNGKDNPALLMLVYWANSVNYDSVIVGELPPTNMSHMLLHTVAVQG